MPATTVLALIAAVLATSTLSGVFGMVGGMVLLWFLLLALPVSTAIAVQGMLQLVANLSRAWFARGWIEWRIIARSTLGLAAAVGLLGLVSYKPDVAWVSVGIGFLPLFAWMPRHWSHLDVTRRSHAVACGFTGGLLNIGVGVAGPIVDIFFVRTTMDRRAVIATKAVLQVLSHVAKIVYYSATLLALSRAEVTALALAAPFSVLGSRLGHRILVRLSNETFRAGTVWLVTAVGAFFFVQGVWMLATR